MFKFTLILLVFIPSMLCAASWDDYEKAHYMDYIRIAYGQVAMQDKEMNKDYGTGFGIMGDIYFYRNRFRKFSSWNSIAFYSRLAFRRFAVSDSEAANRGLYKDSTIDIVSFDIGMRYAIGGFFLGQLFQIYILAAPRGVSASEYAVNDDNLDVGKTYYSAGVVGGAGVEFTLFTYIGIFAEYNFGYVPIGSNKSNIEGHQFYGGMAYRNRIEW